MWDYGLLTRLLLDSCTTVIGVVNLDTPPIRYAEVTELPHVAMSVMVTFIFVLRIGLAELVQVPFGK
jgi:hypothetical protein